MANRRGVLPTLLRLTLTSMTEIGAEHLQQRQLLEEATSAAARALCGGRDLRFQGHVMHLGERVVPVRAPHVQPGSATADDQGIRGCADGVALRLLHTDWDVYQRFRPESAEADLIYEVLEQFRVESLAPSSLSGVRANTRYQFHRWSDACLAEGLLENDTGLLIFTVLHVCRSRIMNEPIPERINDYTEATRAGTHQYFGQYVKALRGLIDNQTEFAQCAANIAAVVSDLVQSSDEPQGAARLRVGLLAMHQLDRSRSDQGDSSASSGSDSTLGDLTDRTYRVYATEYDRTVHIRNEAPHHSCVSGRLRIDEIERSHRPLAAYFNRTLQGLLLATGDKTWHSDLEEGFIDPRVLARLAAGDADTNIYRAALPTLHPNGAVSILIDCSGSMKGNIEQVAVLVDMFVRALDRLDIAVEVLGFTTGAWHGGRVRAKWVNEGRHRNPGRLNEICHLIFKDGHESWRESKEALGGLVWLPMFREGVDGEALIWAYERLLRITSPTKHLIFISDGSPRDGSSMLANQEDFLDQHLANAATAIEKSGTVAIMGLGIGHDMSMFLRRSSVVDPQQILSPEVAKTLVRFLAAC